MALWLSQAQSMTTTSKNNNNMILDLSELKALCDPRPRGMLFQPELAVRHDNETFDQWCIRFKKMAGIYPNFNEWYSAPFPKVVMPSCITSEKYIWCVKNFGLGTFCEASEPYGDKKLWIFNNDLDAVQFKLTWIGSTD